MVVGTSTATVLRREGLPCLACHLKECPIGPPLHGDARPRRRGAARAVATACAAAARRAAEDSPDAPGRTVRRPRADRPRRPRSPTPRARGRVPARGGATCASSVARRIVGLDDVVEQVLIAILAEGHALLEGVPGLAKTLLVSSIAELLDLSFRRIQFTPDLMPSDVTGSEVLVAGRGRAGASSASCEGPLFANVVLADEINRTPPKTQAALMEAMEERQVTSLGVRRPLDRPVLRARHAEPDRAGGHLPAARRAARPLPVQDPPRLPDVRATRRASCGSRPRRSPAEGRAVVTQRRAPGLPGAPSPAPTSRPDARALRGRPRRAPRARRSPTRSDGRARLRRRGAPARAPRRPS